MTNKPNSDVVRTNKDVPMDCPLWFETYNQDMDKVVRKLRDQADQIASLYRGDNIFIDVNAQTQTTITHNNDSVTIGGVQLVDESVTNGTSDKAARSDHHHQILWCPSMGFYISGSAITANTWYQMNAVLDAPDDAAKHYTNAYGGIKVRYAGTLLGLSVSHQGANRGDGANIQFTVERFGSTLTGAPVTDKGDAYNVINTTDGTSEVARGDILYLKVKTSDTLNDTSIISAFVTLDIAVTTW